MTASTMKRAILLSDHPSQRWHFSCVVEKHNPTPHHRRDQFIDEYFPDRVASQSPGQYLLPEGWLSVQASEVGFRRFRPNPDVPDEIPQERITAVTIAAENAFWDKVARLFPECESGDLAPDLASRLQEVMMEAVYNWAHDNRGKEV